MKHQFVAAYVYQMAGQFFGLGILLLSARMLGPDDRGIFAAVTTIGATVGTLCSLSVGKVLLHEMERRRTGLDYPRRQLLGALLAVLSCGGLAGIAVTLCLHWLNPLWFGSVPLELLLITLIALPFYLWQNAAAQVYSVLDGNVALQLIGALFKLVTLAAVIAGFLVGDMGLRGFLFIVSIFLLAEFVLEVAYARRLAGAGGMVDWGMVCRLARQGVRIHLDTIGLLLQGAASVLILNYYWSPEPLGYFNLAMQFISFLLVWPMIVSRFLQSLVAQQGADVAWIAYRRLLFITLGTLVPLVMVGYLAFWAIIDLLLPRFSPSFGIALALIPYLAFNSFATLMNPQWLARGRFGTMSIFGLTAGLIGVGVALVAVPRLSVWGAVSATVATYAFAFVVNAWLFMHLNRRLTD